MKTLYISKVGLDYDKLKTIISSHSALWDVDCTIYKSESFTSWSFESSAKIEFFAISDKLIMEVYRAIREYMWINCAVLDDQDNWYFWCIVKSPLNKNTSLKCTDE